MFLNFYVSKKISRPWEQHLHVFPEILFITKFAGVAYFTNMRQRNKLKITSDVGNAPKKLTYFDSLKEAVKLQIWKPDGI